MRRRVWLGVLFVLVFAIGLVTGWFSSRMFAVKPDLLTLDAGDALDALVTLIVGLMVTVGFQHYFAESRSEKDLLIQASREVESTLKQTRDVFLRAFAAPAPVPHTDTRPLNRSHSDESRHEFRYGLNFASGTHRLHSRQS